MTDDDEPSADEDEPPTPEKSKKKGEAIEKLSQGIKDGFEKNKNEPLPEDLIDLLKKQNED